MRDLDLGPWLVGAAIVAVLIWIAACSGGESVEDCVAGRLTGETLYYGGDAYHEMVSLPEVLETIARCEETWRP